MTEMTRDVEDLFNSVLAADPSLKAELEIARMFQRVYMKLKRNGYHFKPLQIRAVAFPYLYTEEYKHLNTTQIILINQEIENEANK